MAFVEECVGDSSKDVIGSVKRAAKALFQAVIHNVEQEAASDENPKDLDGLLCERNKLHLERIKLEAELQFRQGLATSPLGDAEIGEENSSMEAAAKQIEQLEEDLLSAKLKHLQENKLFECLHHHDYVMKELFPKDGDSNLPDTSVQRIIHEQTELVSEVLYNVKEIEKLKKEVTAIRKERTHIQCQCRELMAKLDEHMKDDNAVSDKERSPSADSTERLVHRSSNEVTLLRHTLLCLIAGSGVDWSQDEELCELVLSLGQDS